jgi:hypothetical protein
VPRLRGRVEQGKIVIQTLFSSALCAVKSTFSTHQSAADDVFVLVVSLARHGLVPRPREGALHKSTPLSSCLPGNMRVVSFDELPSMFLKWDNDFRLVTFNTNFETYERLAKDDSASGAGGFIVAVERGQHFSAA